MGLGRVRRGLVRVLGPIGGYRALHFGLRHSPRILMYHRFSHEPEPRKMAAAAFERHLETLKRDFRPMTMGELGDYLANGRSTPPHAAVITIDDGYRDTLEVAVPLLRKHGVPATLFATTRFVNGDIWLWPDRLEYALFRTRESTLSLQGHEAWPIGTDAERWIAWQRLCDICTRAAHADKEALLAEVEARLNVQLPARPPEECAALDWAALAAVADSGVEIGAHTRTHPILSRIPVEALPDEIGGSKRDLEEKLGTEVTSFCYPNGAPEDITPAVKQAVRDAGFRSAVAAYFDHRVTDDLYELKRYGASEDPFQFRRHLYGVEYLSSWLGGRA